MKEHNGFVLFKVLRRNFRWNYKVHKKYCLNYITQGNKIINLLKREFFSYHTFIKNAKISIPCFCKKKKIFMKTNNNMSYKKSGGKNKARKREK